MGKVPGFFIRQWIARPLAVFSGCFLLGMLAADRLGVPIECSILFALASVGAIVLLRKHRIRFVFWTLLALSLGCMRMLLAIDACSPIPEQFSVNFDGVIVSEPTMNKRADRIVCELELTSVEGVPRSEHVRLYLRSEILPLDGVEYGQRLSGFGHLWPQDSATNPFEFDQRKYLLSAGMRGMAAAKLEDVVLSEPEPNLEGRIIALRRAIGTRIELLFPKNAELVKAFILGDRSHLSEDVTESFRRTGITHLISISGMHISVLSFAISALLRRWLPRNAAVLTTLVIVFLYGALLGFSATLVRAALMFALFSLAPLAGRNSDTVTRLFATLLIMLIVRPIYLYDSGFALSFWASAGIILLQPSLRELLKIDRIHERLPGMKPRQRMLRSAVTYLPELMSTTLAAQISTLPIIISLFGAQSLLSLPVNLFAIPLAMLAYPIALAALCISYLWLPLGTVVARTADEMFWLLTISVRFFADLSSNELRAPRYPAWLLALHCVLLLAGSELSRLSAKFRQFAVFPLTALLGISMLCAWMGTLGFEITFLDAGQADAAVVRADGKVCLFDVGDPYSPTTDFISACCLGVDALFLSHPHYDHAGGLTELLEAMPPKIIYVPEGWFAAKADDEVASTIQLAQDLKISIVQLSAGDTISLTDEMRILVHAPNGDEETVNDLSLMLELQHRSRSVLFTGDVSEDGEPEVIPDVDILKVAHHGSRKASTLRFLEAASPEIAVIPVGDNNYGHPSEETMERLHSVGATVYRTDQHGAIALRIDSNGALSVQTYLSMEGDSL